ncbi:hypothetical protein [Geoalkalibacter sp.]|uniref:hypothetical protein n=1 Tax=Geoalkalibacter sp. TaxID=3041440 RepID=UPI00272EC43B|nr:hypothetical protein [Geoalkalibacter sp.]
MSVYRRWFCSCSGKPEELIYDQVLEEEVPGEPVCERCGAGPSSDPKRTISFRDEEEFNE